MTAESNYDMAATVDPQAATGDDQDFVIVDPDAASTPDDHQAGDKW